MSDSFLAQKVNIGGQDIEGPLSGINNIGQLVSRLLLFLIPAAGVILLLVLIWGGYDFLISQSNPEKVKGAQAKITTGIIGFILLVISYLLVRLIARIFGLGEGIL